MKAQPLEYDIDKLLREHQDRRILHRSPGIHLSTIAKRIVSRFDPERFSRPEDRALFQIGFSWEDILSAGLGRSLGGKQLEVQADRIFLTLDGMRTDGGRWRTQEFKSTKISAATPITSRRFWYWHIQMMGGCRAMDTTECELIVLHINGAYELGGGRFGATVPRGYLMAFTGLEIRENWDMVLRERDAIEHEEKKRGGRR